MTTDLPALCQRLRALHGQAKPGIHNAIVGMLVGANPMWHGPTVVYYVELYAMLPTLLAALERTALAEAYCAAQERADEWIDVEYSDDDEWGSEYVMRQIIRDNARTAWRAARDEAGDDGDGVR